MKKVLAILLAMVFVLGIAACGKGETKEGSLKVGAIMVGDESEGYTKAHMDGINDAVKKLQDEGYDISVDYKKMVPESAEVQSNAIDLIANGCTLIITNSYGHQDFIGEVAEKNPEINFVSMTGDKAAKSGLSNYFNAFTKVYESRYVSGIVAGMKIQSLLDSGELTKEAYPSSFDGDNIKIGYVGAYNYAEVVSGYTAFYLGAKSVVDNIVMTVKYTNSWFDEQKEAAVAEYLMNQGCVIIGQHADSTGAPAAVQKAFTAGTNKMCFSVGYNVPMTKTGPDVVLTSASNNWEAYYETLFRAALEGAAIPQDWAEGYEKDAVYITELGTPCAPGTQEAVDAAIAGIKDGSIKVFNTANFTVGGQNLTSYTDSFGMDGAETIKSENGVTFFDESSLRSAPYFDIRIDGITELTDEAA